MHHDVDHARELTERQRVDAFDLLEDGTVDVVVGRVSALEELQRDPGFLEGAGATVVVDPRFTIRAATPSYVDVTGRPLDELLGVNLFEAFPDNPDVPAEQPTATLARSVEDVLRNRSTRHLAPMRYDIPDPQRPGRFVERRWVIVNAPVVDGDAVVGARIRGYDLTLAEDRLLRVLRDYRDVLEGGDLRGDGARARLDLLNGYLELVEEHGRLAAEVSGLREAMRTRATIEQAKGIIMADRRCSADEAWELLRKLSMDSNVRVADVAAALVYEAQRP